MSHAHAWLETVWGLAPYSGRWVGATHTLPHLPLAGALAAFFVPRQVPTRKKKKTEHPNGALNIARIPVCSSRIAYPRELLPIWRAPIVDPRRAQTIQRRASAQIAIPPRRRRLVHAAPAADATWSGNSGSHTSLLTEFSIGASPSEETNYYFCVYNLWHYT